MTTSQRFESVWDALQPGLEDAHKPLSGAQPTDTPAAPVRRSGAVSVALPIASGNLTHEPKSATPARDTFSASSPIDFDDRVTCQTCVRLWHTPAGAHACTDHRRAGLTTRELALDFTHLAQNCPAWSAKP